MTLTLAHARLLQAMFLTPTQHRDGRYSVAGIATANTYWLSADLKTCSCKQDACVHVSAVLLRLGDRTGERADFEQVWGSVQPPPLLATGQTTGGVRYGGSFRRVDGEAAKPLTMGDEVTVSWPAYIAANAAATMTKTGSVPVCVENSHVGESLVLCGSGPSLAAHAAEFCGKADAVWGCNAALTWLLDRGHKATAGFCVDSTRGILTADKWNRAPNVEYILASSVHPHLVECLLTRSRRLRFYHSFVGDFHRSIGKVPYHRHLCELLYSPTICAGLGLNAVPRAIDVAMFMGFARITVLGADCATDAGTIEGVVDGRSWRTHADLMISAVEMAKMQRKAPTQVQFIGDTMPNALLSYRDKLISERGEAKGDRRWRAFLRSLPSLDRSGRAVA